MKKITFEKLQPPFVSAEPVMAEKPDFFYEEFTNGATVEARANARSNMRTCNILGTIATEIKLDFRKT